MLGMTERHNFFNQVLQDHYLSLRFHLGHLVDGNARN